MPVSATSRAARNESRVSIPYSGPAAKSASGPSVSGMTTVYPAASIGPNIAISPDTMVPPRLKLRPLGVHCPIGVLPAMAREGLSSGLSES